MRRVVTYCWNGFKLLLLGTCALLLVTLRYILRLPQPLSSVLPGEARLYKWKLGHIYYKVAGPATAPPLVLFHAPGIGASAYEMRYLAEALAQHYRVYAPDLLGFALSDHPQTDYSAALYVSLFEDFLREVVQQPAVLLASGLSCNYCVAVAERSPELCHRLVLLSPATVFEERRPRPLQVALSARTLLGFVLYSYTASRPALRLLLRNALTGSVEEDILDHAYAVAHQFRAHRAPLALLAGRLYLNVGEPLARLSQPVQIIWGERALFALSRLASASPQIQVAVIQHTDTRPHEERPDQVIPYLLPSAIDEPTPAQPTALEGVAEIAIPTPDIASLLDQQVTTSPVEEGPTISGPLAATEEERVEPEAVISDTPAVPEEEPPAPEAAISNIPAIVEAAPEGQSEDQSVSATIQQEASGEHAPEREETPLEETPLDEEATPLAEDHIRTSTNKKTHSAHHETLSQQEAVEAYCFKCKKKRKMRKAHKITTKNGRSAMEGSCPVCDTRLFRFIAAEGK